MSTKMNPTTCSKVVFINQTSLFGKHFVNCFFSFSSFFFDSCWRSFERSSQFDLHSTCRFLLWRGLDWTPGNGSRGNPPGYRWSHPRFFAQLRQQGISGLAPFLHLGSNFTFFFVFTGIFSWIWTRIICLWVFGCPWERTRRSSFSSGWIEWWLLRCPSRRARSTGS